MIFITLTSYIWKKKHRWRKCFMKKPLSILKITITYLLVSHLICHTLCIIHLDLSHKTLTLAFFRLNIPLVPPSLFTVNYDSALAERLPPVALGVAVCVGSIPNHPNAFADISASSAVVAGRTARRKYPRHSKAIPARQSDFKGKRKVSRHISGFVASICPRILTYW